MENNKEESVTNNETRKHIINVIKYISVIIGNLLERISDHDKSKMEDPELKLFVDLTPKLSSSTYGSPEYQEFMRQLKPALDHHYGRNRHHPEHYADGINDMNLVDLIEMFCDWKAATLRHNDGNILKSIEHNTNRFEISPQLAKIFRNTAELLEKI